MCAGNLKETSGFEELYRCFLIPTPGIVVLHRHCEHYAKPEEAGYGEEADKLRAVFDVHEEKYHERGLDQGDNQGDGCIEKTQIDEGDCDGDCRADHEGEEDQEIDLERDNMVIRHNPYQFRLDVATDQIEQRKEEDPHDIDEVPVETADFDRREILRTNFTTTHLGDHPQHDADAYNHVKGMHTRHHEVERKEDFGITE